MKIELKNIRKTIDSLKFKNVTYADDHNTHLNNLSIDLKLNKVVWVQGDASKTWLMRIMAGLTNPTSGTYFINNTNVAEMSFEEFLPYRLNMGYSFAYGGLLNNKTLKENLMLPFLYHGLSYKKVQAHVEEYIDTFHIEKYKNCRPAEVPGIFRKITCFVRAMAIEPQVLVMNDPMSSVNTEIGQIFKQWIEKKQSSEGGLSVFIASDDGHFFENLQHETLLVSA